MSIWSCSRRRPIVSNQRYAQACAAWEDAHGSVRDDFDAGQWIRYCAWVVILDLGLNVDRLAFGRWCVETGRLSDEVIVP